jgi:hypothetical protein
VRTALLAALVTGCGRLGFDAVATPPGDAAVDAPANAVTVTLEATADTYLSTAALSDANFGASPMLVLNDAPQRHPLLRFDTTSLPSGAAVFSATLTVVATASSPTANKGNVHVLREDWVEGTNNGAIGAASWNQRIPGVAWAGPGASTPSSVAAASGLFAVGGPGRYDIAIDRTVVGNWLADPATNFGVMIACACSMQLASREAADRPTLTVIYVP